MTPHRLAQLAIVTMFAAGFGWAAAPLAAPSPQLTVREYRVPAGSHPHDVAPARDGTVWAGKIAVYDPRRRSWRELRGGAESGADKLVLVRTG